MTRKISQFARDTGYIRVIVSLILLDPPLVSLRLVVGHRPYCILSLASKISSTQTAC